jgi:hypothetical protein
MVFFVFVSSSRRAIRTRLLARLGKLIDASETLTVT